MLYQVFSHHSTLSFFSHLHTLRTMHDLGMGEGCSVVKKKVKNRDILAKFPILS